MWEPEEPLKTFYEMSKGEWQPDGCGELPLWQCDPVLKVRVCCLEVHTAPKRATTETIIM